MNIITDIDGVLLDWNNGFDVWLKNVKHIKGKHDCAPTTYGMQDKYNLTDKQILTLINEFNSTEDFGHLQGIRDAVDVVPNIISDEQFDWFWISCFLPVNGSNQLVRERRNRNIYTSFNRYIPGICLELRESKINSLMTFDANNSIFVEDSLHHAQDSAECGFKTFLIDYPYNQSEKPLSSKIIRVKTWAEIRDHLNESK